MRAQATSGTAAWVTWSDNSQAETAHVIRISTDGGVTWADATTVPANATGGAVTGLTPSTQYQFQMITQNGTGSSSPGNDPGGRTKSDANLLYVRREVNYTTISM